MMREEIMDGIRKHIHPLQGLEQAKLLEVSPGHAKISLEIPPEALNLYGNLHGGFIFTLCDMVSGMATYAYEVSNVTLQGNINFLKGISSGTIFVEGNTVHKGGKTAINQVDITSEEGDLIAAATFSMFLFEQIDVS